MVIRWGGRLVGAGLVAWVALGGPAFGEKLPGPASAGMPAMDDVLDMLHANYEEYAHSVPNLFCDEKVWSEYGRFSSPVKLSHTLTESLFRLRRKVGEDQKITLVESRQVRRVDGKAVEKDALSGPSILYGVFGYSIGLISKDEEKCSSFSMKRAGNKRGRRRLEIDFKPLRTEDRDASCADRRWQGKAFVDVETMQLSRIEMKTQNYEIVKGMQGDWDWEADYDPVLLMGKSFWLPSTIKSRAASYANNPEEWTFTAEYRNYHKMAAAGRIVPGTVEELPDVPGGEKPPH